MKKLFSILLIFSFVLMGFCADAAPPAGKGGGQGGGKGAKLNAPSDLLATAVSASQIDLTWQDNSDNETGFKIERSLDGETFSEVDQVGADVASYSDTGLSENTTYYYQVRAFKQGKKKVDYSDYSNVATATTFDTAPAAPADLSATAVSASQIDLTWQDNSDNETGFKIERSLDGVNFSEVDQVGADIASYSDTGLSSITAYYYRVRAFNAYGYSGYSNIAGAVTFDTAPAVPSNLVAIHMGSTTDWAVLTWQDNSDNETGFKVERSEDGVNFSEIGGSPAGWTWFNDNFVMSGKTYYYRVRTYNGFGFSGYSNVAEITIP